MNLTRMVAALAWCVGAVAHAAGPDTSALAGGLHVTAMTTAFNREARADNEPLVALRDCKDQPPGNKPLKAWTCKTGFPAFVYGVARQDGAVQNAMLMSRPEGTDDLQRMRRAAGYLLRVSRGGPPRGDGVIVLEMLTAALKSPGTVVTRLDGDLRIMAVNGRDGAWEFGVERLH